MNFKFNAHELTACRILSGNTDISDLDESFFEFAKNNQIASIIAHNLKDSKIKVNECIMRKFNTEHDKIDKYISSVMDEVDRIANVLFNQKIVAVVLKNGGIARGIYHCYGCCPMGDIDLLVDKKDFLQAHQTIINDGYTFKFRFKFYNNDLETALQNGGAEYFKKLSSGELLWLELQFRSVSGRWIGLDQEPCVEDLIKRSLMVKNSKIRILSPQDNLLQVVLHTAKHTYVREPGVRLHTDVDRIVRYQKINWENFVHEVKKRKVKTAAYFSLLIPSEIMNTPIPEFVLRQLEPLSVKKRLLISMLNRAGLFNPQTRKFNKMSYIVFCILLYDSPVQLIKNLFPNKNAIRNEYSGQSRMLFLQYLRRLFNYFYIRNRT